MKLTEEEMEVVKHHPVIAEKILSNLSFLKGVMPIIRHHHEEFDGSGYPDGLKGKEIPIGARILCIIDCWNAMVSKRSHREALREAEALKEIKGQSTKKFDLDLIGHFEKYLKSSESSPDNEKQEQEGENKIKETILELVRKLKRGDILLPILPKVIQEIREVMKDTDVNVGKLAKVVEKDTIFSVSLISVANSSLYRGTGEINTVNKAITRLGFEETQSIITAIANKNLYVTKNEHYKTIMEKLWIHSLACAYGSKLVAKKVGFDDLEKIFLMGLVHDIGKVLLVKAFNEYQAQSNSYQINDVMKTIQEVHTSIGGAILQKWGFHQEFINIARKHTGPKFSDNTKKEILIVNLANYLTRNMGYSLFNDKIELSSLDSVRLLEIKEDQLEVLNEEMKKTMEATNNMF